MVPSWLRIPLAAVGVMLLGSLPLLAAPHSTKAPDPALARLAVNSSLAHSGAASGLMVLAQASTPASPNAAPNVAGTTCMTCHGSVPKYPILGARMTYDHSTHKNGGNSAYANGGGCQKCHTNEGFIDFVAKGTVDDKAFVKYPSQPSCTTCHAPHETGDMSLRTVKPVTLANKEVFDLGSGNLCANCHQGRQNAATYVKALAANTISGSWGIHHGPQADMLLGTNAYEVAGKSYSNSEHTTEVEDGCVTCHMSLPEGRYGFSPELGGHSFNISAEVHEVEKLNASGCVGCHEGMKQEAGKTAWSKAGGAGVIWLEKPTVFSVQASADYDQDGQKEVVQEEVQGLMDKMVNQAGTGLLQQSTPPLYDAKGAYVGNQSKDTLPTEKVAALYNYKYVLEDRSRGIHNTNYTFQVLYDTIALLDPNFNTALRPK